MSTLAAKGRGDKREYLYADDSTQLRSSTMDRSLETFPKSIHYPVSRDTISPVDPKKPIYLNQVNTYLTYPTPTPSISTQRRSPKNHHHQHQRLIDRFTPQSVLIINISKIMLPSLPLLFLLLPSLLTTAQKLPLDSTSHNHIQITLRPYKSNSCTNPARRGKGAGHSITLKANHRADISSSSGIKIGEITHSKCVGFPRGGFNSFVFDGEGLYGIADGNGEGEGNGEGGVVKVKERMGRCRVDVFPNRLCLGDVMGGLGEVGFLFLFLFSVCLWKILFLSAFFVRSFD